MRYDNYGGTIYWRCSSSSSVYDVTCNIRCSIIAAPGNLRAPAEMADVAEIMLYVCTLWRNKLPTKLIQLGTAWLRSLALTLHRRAAAVATSVWWV